MKSATKSAVSTAARSLRWRVIEQAPAVRCAEVTTLPLGPGMA